MTYRSCCHFLFATVVLAATAPALAETPVATAKFSCADGKSIEASFKYLKGMQY